MDVWIETPGHRHEHPGTHSQHPTGPARDPAPAPDPVTSSRLARPPPPRIPLAPTCPNPRFSAQLSPGSSGVSLLPTHRRAHAASMHPDTQYLVPLWHHGGLEAAPTPTTLEAKGPPCPWGLSLPGLREGPSPEPPPTRAGSPQQQAPSNPARPRVDGPCGPAPRPFPSTRYPLLVCWVLCLSRLGRAVDTAPVRSPSPGFCLDFAPVTLFILFKKNSNRSQRLEPPGSPQSPHPPLSGPSQN